MEKQKLKPNKKKIIEDNKNKGREKNSNPMREIEIEKMVLNCGGIDDKLEKGVKLLEMITGKKVLQTIAKKRIPGFGIRPKLEVGCMVTLRGEEAAELLGRLLAAIDNQLAEEQIADNHFSFGIAEYIEIPGEEYDREIGMIGFKVAVVFKRKGKRVKEKKIKRGKLPKKQIVTKEEIVKFMENKYDTEFE